VLRGKIESWNGADGLGNILLEDGRIVRFGGRNLQLEGRRPDVGVAVLVDSLEPHHSGGLRATTVRHPSFVWTPAQQFEALLAADDTRAYRLLSYRELSFADRHRFGRQLIDWTSAHRDQLDPYNAYELLKHVPLDLWTGDELLWAIAAGADFTTFAEELGPLVLRARELLGDDPRIAVLEQRAADANAQYEDSVRDPLGARLRTRPDFTLIEDLFATKLPAKLREAWLQAYELPHDKRQFLTPTHKQLDDLATTAQFIADEHAYALKPIAGKPHRLLPFARGPEDSDYYVLDLALPTADGDFAVRLMQHDVVDGIDQVAPTSAKWLTRRR
jgi:hypothetical protein